MSDGASADAPRWSDRRWVMFSFCCSTHRAWGCIDPVHLLHRQTSLLCFRQCWSQKGLAGREREEKPKFYGADSDKPVDRGVHRGTVLNLTALVIWEAEHNPVWSIWFLFYRQKPKRPKTGANGAIFSVRLRHWRRSWSNEKKLPWLQPLLVPVLSLLQIQVQDILCLQYCASFGKTDINHVPCNAASCQDRREA